MLVPADPRPRRRGAARARCRRLDRARDRGARLAVAGRPERYNRTANAYGAPVDLAGVFVFAGTTSAARGTLLTGVSVGLPAQEPRDALRRATRRCAKCGSEFRGSSNERVCDDCARGLRAARK